jgi:hypothetical protein
MQLDKKSTIKFKTIISNKALSDFEDDAEA